MNQLPQKVQVQKDNGIARISCGSHLGETRPVPTTYRRPLPGLGVETVSAKEPDSSSWELCCYMEKEAAWEEKPTQVKCDEIEQISMLKSP